MLAAGAAGFVLRQAGFPMGPLVLALILGPMAESNLRRALVLSQRDPTILVTRPIALTLLAITAISLIWRSSAAGARPRGRMRREPRRRGARPDGTAADPDWYGGRVRLLDRRPGVAGHRVPDPARSRRARLLLLSLTRPLPAGLAPS